MLKRKPRLLLAACQPSIASSISGSASEVTQNGKAAGRNSIYAILDGCAISETWAGAGGFVVICGGCLQRLRAFHC